MQVDPLLRIVHRRLADDCPTTPRRYTTAQLIAWRDHLPAEERRALNKFCARLGRIRSLGDLGCLEIVVCVLGFSL